MQKKILVFLQVHMYDSIIRMCTVLLKNMDIGYTCNKITIPDEL